MRLHPVGCQWLICSGWRVFFPIAAPPLAIPGGAAFGSSNGLEAAQAVLALNAWWITWVRRAVCSSALPHAVNPDLPQLPNSVVEVNDLIGRMRQGEVKTLVHPWINPLFELPAGLGI